MNGYADRLSDCFLQVNTNRSSITILLNAVFVLYLWSWSFFYEMNDNHQMKLLWPPPPLSLSLYATKTVRHTLSFTFIKGNWLSICYCWLFYYVFCFLIDILCLQKQWIECKNADGNIRFFDDSDSEITKRFYTCFFQPLPLIYLCALLQNFIISIHFNFRTQLWSSSKTWKRDQYLEHYCWCWEYEKKIVWW